MLLDQFGQPLNKDNAAKITGLDGQELKADPVDHKIKVQAEYLTDEQKEELRLQLTDTYGFVFVMTELAPGKKYGMNPATMAVVDNMRELVRAFDPELVGTLEREAKAGTLEVEPKVRQRAMLQTELNAAAAFAKAQGWGRGRATAHLEKTHRQFVERHSPSKTVKSEKRSDAMLRSMNRAEKARKKAHKAAAATDNQITDIQSISF